MPKKAKRANPKNLKKTTRKGAYKPARKKQMVIRRAPMVESKKDERFEWTGKSYYKESAGAASTWGDNLVFQDLPIGDNPNASDPAESIFMVGDVPDTFMYRTQGFGPTEMIGESVFIKYLKMKFEIKLPQDNGLIHFPQCQLYLVHGFIEKSIDANEDTTKKLADLTRDDISDFVVAQISEYFSNSNEPMRYQPLGRNFSSCKILGKKEIKWNKAKSILPDPVRSGSSATDQWGELPTKVVECSWPMMKKVRYEQLPQGTRNPDDATRSSNYFVNHHENIPFWALYMPGGDKIIYSDSQNRVQFRANDVCYYTDS